MHNVCGVSMIKKIIQYFKQKYLITKIMEQISFIFHNSYYFLRLPVPIYSSLV